MATDLALLDRATRVIIESSEQSRHQATYFAKYGVGARDTTSSFILFRRIIWQYELMLAGAGSKLP